MADAASFRGYGPEQGYDFLREAIATHDFQARGAQIEADEIFVSDGAKSDTGNIQEIFARMCAWPSPIRCTRCMWTPTSWPGAPMPPSMAATRLGLSGQHRGQRLCAALPSEPVDVSLPVAFRTTPPGPRAARAQLAAWVDAPTRTGR